MLSKSPLILCRGIKYLKDALFDQIGNNTIMRRIRMKLYIKSSVFTATVHKKSIVLFMKLDRENL